MGEIKSVKVDNWGVFFLQKLQNFFNKTDYCDLTLQFHDNSQLKVHRLVLSACTDYFNVLEHTCDMVDDALIMPNELQADVVVPIVNFMYTGTLEFELKMYGKLLRTAKEMNMTVLLKLLEAHRRTMEGVGRLQRPPSPKAIRRTRPNTQPTSSQQQRRVLTTSNNTPTSTLQQQQQRRIIQTKNTSPQLQQQSQQQVQYRQQIGATSLLKTTTMGTGTSPVKIQYGMNIYGAQQEVKQEPEEFESKQQPTSPFEQLRKGYNNNKRPTTTTFVSPPAKKPNIEDVKEFAEQQRMRKQIAAEFGDDTEYEGVLDDDIHNDDDDDDATMASSSNAVHATTSRQQQTQQQLPPGTTTITFKQDQGDKPATIVVKDSSNSKMNHAKIISEVLRQYPNLVKGNKNIKLKIMPNTSGGQTQKIIVKKEQVSDDAEVVAGAAGQLKLSPKPIITSQTLLKPMEKVTSQQQKQQPAAAKVQPSKTVLATGIQASSTAVATASTGVTGTQKRRIDSKTMHALIALGAENTTGPWLCLRCGVNGRPISIPSYRGFRRHLINTHKEAIDAALCEHCGWRSSNNRELHFHSQVEHKVKTTLYTFPECLLCSELFLDTNALNQHMLDSHPDENKQQCIYCNKIFAREQQLYTHMKTFHKKQALEDGIIDYADIEFASSHMDIEANIEQHHLQSQSNIAIAKRDKESKIKILSDISLPNAGSLIKLEPSSEAAALNTIASGIATSIGITGSEEFIQISENAEVSGEPKFVNAEGNEMLLTDEQRKEIMSQLNQEHGGVVMVLNDSTFPVEETAETSAAHDTPMEEETAIADDENSAENAASTAEQEFDESEIYGDLMSQTRSAGQDAKKNITNALDESKESTDNLEWAENLISAHEMADEADAAVSKVAEEKAKKDDDISKKLKELTGDWTDDDEEEPEEEETEEDEPVTSPEKKATEATTDVAEKEVLETELKADENKADLDTKNVESNEESVKLEEPQTEEDDIEKAMKSLHNDHRIESDDEEQTELEKDKEDVDGDIDVEEKKDKEKEEEEEDKEEEEEDKEEEEEIGDVDRDVGEKEDTVVKVEKIDEEKVLEDARKEDELDKVIEADDEISDRDDEEFQCIKINKDGGDETNEKSKQNIEEVTAAAAAATHEGETEEEIEKEVVKENVNVAEEGKEKSIAETTPDEPEKEVEKAKDEDVEMEEEKEKDTDATTTTTAATATTSDEPMETDETDNELTAKDTETATEDDAIKNEKENVNTAIKTEDKVKSLISEWDNDDDDDENEDDSERL